MLLHPMAQQRPRLHGHDRRLVRPLFGELAPAVDDLVQQRAVVATQTGEGHEVVRGNEDVHEIDLQQAEPPDRAAQVVRGHPAARPGMVETLRRERDAPGLGDRELSSRHRAGRGRATGSVRATPGRPARSPARSAPAPGPRPGLRLGRDALPHEGPVADAGERPRGAQAVRPILSRITVRAHRAGPPAIGAAQPSSQPGLERKRCTSSAATRWPAADQCPS